MELAGKILIAVLSSLIGLMEASDCNYTQTVMPGLTYYIYNPDYPSYTIGPVRCQWTINIPQGDTVSLNCSVSSYSGMNRCTTLTVRGTNNDGSYCRSFAAESNGESAVLTFNQRYEQWNKY